MTYVTEQTSAELRAHMRRLQAMPGWHNPLDDRLFSEVVEQDKEIEHLRAALASREEAPVTPQAEIPAAPSVGERYCNKCGYFGRAQLHDRPDGSGQCGYLARIRTQPTTVQQADVEAHRQQIANLILGDDLRVSSLLESTQGFGGDIEHRFQISNGTERYGVVIIVTALKGMQPGERKDQE